MRICPNPFVLNCSLLGDGDLPPFTTLACLQTSSRTSPYRDLSLRTLLYYRQFTLSLRDRNPYKAYLSKTETSIMRTLIPFLLVSVIKRFDYISFAESVQQRKQEASVRRLEQLARITESVDSRAPVNPQSH